MKSYIDSNRLYRDTARRKVSGVCAGLARHFGFETWIVRVTAVVAFYFMPMPMAVAYLMGVLLIPSRSH